MPYADPTKRAERERFRSAVLKAVREKPLSMKELYQACKHLEGVTQENFNMRVAKMVGLKHLEMILLKTRDKSRNLEKVYALPKGQSKALNEKSDEKPLLCDYWPLAYSLPQGEARKVQGVR